MPEGPVPRSLRARNLIMAATETSRITTDIDYDRDGKQTGFLRIPYSVHRSAYGWLPVPVVCIKNGEGPRVLLMSGSHGDEYEGQVINSRLCRELSDSVVRGRIIILPAANYPAARAGRRTSPLDAGGEGNLNRAFPGDPNGGPTAMIAHYIETAMIASKACCCRCRSTSSTFIRGAARSCTCHARWSSEPRMKHWRNGRPKS